MQFGRFDETNFDEVRFDGRSIIQVLNQVTEMELDVEASFERLHWANSVSIFWIWAIFRWTVRTRQAIHANCRSRFIIDKAKAAGVCHDQLRKNFPLCA